jgi:hypothetical protein
VVLLGLDVDELVWYAVDVTLVMLLLMVAFAVVVTLLRLLGRQ